MANTDRPSYNKLKDKILKLEKELNEIKNSQNKSSYSQLIDELYELIKRNKELSEYENQLLKDTETKHKGKKGIKSINEENFRIFDDYYSGIFILHLEKINDSNDLRLVYGNPESEKLLGLNVNDLKGKTIDEIFPEFQKEGIPQLLSEVVILKKPKKIKEISYKLKSIEPGIISIKAFPLYENYIGVSFENITKTRRLQKALKESEVRFRSILNNSNSVIYLKDLSGRYLLINKKFEKILHLGSMDIIGKSDYDIFPEEYAREIVKNDMEVINNKKTIIVEEVFILNDEPYTFLSSKFPIFGDDNNIYAICGISTDISDRKKAEEELIKAKEKAEESDRLKSAFLSNMSHEIRTPMNSILGFSKMLEENLLEENRKQYINYIHSSVNQLLKIINDIIDFSKIESSQLRLHLNDFNLNKLIDDLYTQFESERLAQGKNNLVLSFSKGLDDPDCYIEGDDVRIRQVLSNLLSNAIKFTHKGAVEFGYELEDNDRLNLYVKDTGVGIPESKQNIVFEKFRQEDESFTRQYGGTGLGLAISKGLVALMGGEIGVKSEKNKGSLFYFTVPYKKAGLISKEVQINASDEEYDWGDKTILIIEDDMLGYEFLREILEPTNVKILIEGNGLDAIDLIKRNSDIDLVLMDLRIPKMDGYTATSEIKKIRPELPVIAQTANALPEDKIRAEEAGCDDFITKPISRKEFLLTVNRYI